METIKTIKVAALQEGSPRSWSDRQKMDRPSGPSRVFIDFGEDVWTHLANRRSRDYNALRPLVAAKLEERGIEFTKLRWSRYAGCSMCPCSGGFIIEDGKSWRQDGKDYWAKIDTIDLEKELVAFA